MQLTGGRIALRMRGHHCLQLAVEVVGTDGLQVGGQLEGIVGLTERQQPAGVLDHMGAGGTGGQVRAMLGHVRGALEGGSAHPPVAVPLGAAVPQPEAVHHARCP